MIRFDEQYLTHLATYRQSASVLSRRERYLALLNPLPGERILDLGCGSGGFCRVLAPLVSPGGRVIGVDLSHDAVTLATRLSANAGPGNLAFELGDGHDLRFADGAFDAATCISVLGFCRDPGRVLAELRRALRPGGRLLLVNADEEARRYSGSEGELGRRVRQAIAARGRDPRIGQRLVPLLKGSGFHILKEEVLSDVERHFSPGAAGHTMAHAMRDYLLESGAVSAEEYERWLAELAASAQEGSYGYSMTTFVYLAQVRTGA
jgi:ubiquinone/menaquinone biosynthesis C-methylase UbiE